MAPFSSDQTIRSDVQHARGAPQPAEAPQWTTAAMERFSCLGDRCDDTCCRDWAVEIDKPSLDRMTAVMGRTKEGRDKLVRLVVLGRPTQHAGGAAHLQMDERGACPMLDEKQLCGVHSAYGESTLSTACSVFPRTAVEAQGQLEVGGSLGCPEVTRLVLLAGDRDLELAPASRPMLPRAYVGRRVPNADESARAAAFQPVRAALTRLLRKPGSTLDARFAFAATLAERLDGFLAAVDVERSPARRAFALRRLETELALGEDPAALAQVARDLGTISPPGDATAALVATMLLGRKQLPHGPRFAALLDVAFGSLQEEALGRPASKEDSVTAAQLWQAYRARRERLDALHGETVAAIFANYATHYLQRHPFTDAATIGDYLYKLGLHLAALRLLLAGMPELRASADRELLGRTAVHVVQTYTKAIGHNVGFQETVVRSAEESGGVTFGQLVLLAKFL